MATNHQLPTLHEIRDTPYGGRGAFAVTDIPKDTLVLSCSSPYASVILRKFRKEVCNWCYAYAFEKLGDGKTTPLYFCSEDCLNTWVAAYQGPESVAVWTQLCSSLEKLYLQETVSLSSSKKSPKTPARFILDGLFRRALEDLAAPDAPVENIYNRRVTGLGSWQDLLKLQDMETNTIRTHPEMLASFIRVYGLLRHLIGSTRSSSAILETLRGHISTSTTTRALIARDHSNVFGIWERADNEGESEMLGWGMFISASFFNHDCSPNLKKRAAGRAIDFYTIRDVERGEELCTNYVDVSEGNPVESRTAQLEKGCGVPGNAATSILLLPAKMVIDERVVSADPVLRCPPPKSCCQRDMKFGRVIGYVFIRTEQFPGYCGLVAGTTNVPNPYAWFAPLPPGHWSAGCYESDGSTIRSTQRSENTLNLLITSSERQLNPNGPKRTESSPLSANTRLVASPSQFVASIEFER
ncbi:hypothetical protein BKA70DRAFT_1399702 [Coprinopsis sp. MPI-PUGE-AT-0042]|nr:hypothetical protein BKA70DRAFT_1399702 [Coprinopsis sp. MPI-PUGE-AT-0042]